MKNLMLLLSILFLLIGLSISSCRKSADPKDKLIICIDLGAQTENSTSVTLIGKWSIITDSTYAGVGFNNHPVNYAGQPGDYFDFRNDGKLYTKEGMKTDTSDYKLTSDTTVLIPFFGINLNGVTEISHITNLSNHHVNINAPTIITPGGLFGRKVNLNR